MSEKNVSLEEKDAVSRKSWFLLWTAAALILLVRLGTGAISGSEGRWLAVADEMLKSGDWLHPSINGQPYFDKPLVSYWFIAALSKAAGAVSEWTARLPSAFAALLALGAVINIAKRLFSSRTALAAGWVLCTTYSFVFWGRLAEADMENAAFITAATAWYFHCREQRSFWGYTLFWSICAVGAQTKGLAAFVIPALAAAADMLLNGKLKFHLNWKSICGLLCGLAVYLVPFGLEMFSRGEYGASGVMLVFRENIVRVFNPWDHKDEPFWCYFLHLPRLMLPWTPLLLLALCENCRRVLRRDAAVGEKWLLLTIAVIFLLFTCSRSRRVYYILPVIPFCAILCGKFLTDPGKEWEALIGRLFFRFCAILLPGAALILAAAPLILKFFLPPEWPKAANGLLAAALPVCGAAVGAVWFFGKKYGLFDFLPDFPEAGRVTAALALMVFLFFSLLLPAFQSAPFRTGKPFLAGLREIIFERNKIPENNVAFYEGNYSYAVFYLHLPRPAQLFAARKTDRTNRSFFDDSSEAGGEAEFRSFLKKIDGEGGAVFGRWDKFAALPPDLRRRFMADDGLTPARGVIMEPDNTFESHIRRTSAENPKKLRGLRKKKMLLLVVPPRR